MKFKSLLYLEFTYCVYDQVCGHEIFLKMEWKGHVLPKQ